MSTQPLVAHLLAIVSVPTSSRVQCQNPGCGHGVYAAIHVVEDDGKLLVLGSTCFTKRYGGRLALGKPAYSAGGGNGQVLNEVERQMLKDNTAALIAMFKDQHESRKNAIKAKIHALRSRLAQHGAAPLPDQSQLTSRQSAISRFPWAWQHPRNTSVALFHSASGQSWVRVKHLDGTQKLVPWPMFDGWDEALPPSCGLADPVLQAYCVSDLPKAFATLNQLGYIGPIVGVWPGVLGATEHPGSRKHAGGWIQAPTQADKDCWTLKVEPKPYEPPRTNEYARRKG